MKKLFSAALLLLFTVAAAAQQLPMNEFVDNLMQKMTLGEKLGQLNLLAGDDITTGNGKNSDLAAKIAAGRVGGVFNLKGVAKLKALQKHAVENSRLAIPLLTGMDVIHGYETVFPIPLAMSCSWDMDAIRRAAHIAAVEASADGINWTFSPMVDICVDARWGRVAEGGGEDAWLGSLIARAMVEGYQGDYTAGDNIMACVKHFALYGAVEAGRDYNTVDMSHLRMYNQYLPPYKAAVEAGAGSVMSSFNLVDGVPATANRQLLTDILRGEWGFDGFVVTDYESVKEMKAHGVSDGLKSASVMALRAGTDMDMVSGGFESTLAESLADGTVTLAEIDAACRRVLEAKYRLGLFDNPYKYCDEKRPSRDIYNAAHRKAARDIAASTFVLLKNDAPKTAVPVAGQTDTDGGLLPLERAGHIALIGPLADNRDNMVGTWSVAAAPGKYMSLRRAMEREIEGRGELIYAQGCNLTADEALQKAAEFGRTIPRGDDKLLHDEAMEAARRADVIVCAMGECSDMSGESSSRASLELPDVQRALLADLVATGKPVVLLHFSGRPTVMTWEQEYVTAVMNVWFGGSETADAVCDVLFGDKSPSGRLTMTMPRSVGQLPIYYNHLNTGRPVREGATRYYKFQSNYLDVRNDALYPFGYGLTYTTFDYGEPTVDTATLTPDGSLTATVRVKNTGRRAATETVQLYIRDLVASVSRPVKELRGFERITLAPGESREVAFRITADMLKFYNAQLEYVAEPGDFEIMTGPNSRDVKRKRITLLADKK
ncbi:MAG: beta-glucosidase BglX [Prevotella sp.]